MSTARSVVMGLLAGAAVVASFGLAMVDGVLVRPAGSLGSDLSSTWHLVGVVDPMRSAVFVAAGLISFAVAVLLSAASAIFSGLTARRAYDLWTVLVAALAWGLGVCFGSIPPLLLALAGSDSESGAQGSWLGQVLIVSVAVAGALGFGCLIGIGVASTLSALQTEREYEVRSQVAESARASTAGSGSSGRRWTRDDLYDDRVGRSG